eukprot:3400120-Rhodomonas_salina.1
MAGSSSEVSCLVDKAASVNRHLIQSPLVATCCKPAHCSADPFPRGDGSGWFTCSSAGSGAQIRALALMLVSPCGGKVAKSPCVCITLLRWRGDEICTTVDQNTTEKHV